jgi:hypothetical protein
MTHKKPWSYGAEGDTQKSVKAPQIGPEGWETAYLAILPGALVPLQWSHVDTTLHEEIQNQIKSK